MPKRTVTRRGGEDERRVRASPPLALLSADIWGDPASPALLGCQPRIAPGLPGRREGPRMLRKARGGGSAGRRAAPGGGPWEAAGGAAPGSAVRGCGKGRGGAGMGGAARRWGSAAGLSLAQRRRGSM